MPSAIQAILFDRQQHTTQSARKWLSSHNFKPIKRVHTTKNYFRYRIRDPDIFHNFVTTAGHNGVVFIIGFY